LRRYSLNILFTLSFTVFINTFSFAFQDLPNEGTKLPAEKEEVEKVILLDSF